MLRRLTRHPRTQAAIAAALGAYLALVFRSTRWSLLGASHITAAFEPGPPIAAFWHERLPLMPMLWMTASRSVPGMTGVTGHVLVSRHRDGRLIGAVVERFALALVHGSSSRGGAVGLREMARVLAAGGMVVITPDGPRGPARTAAPGVAALAALTGRSVLPCAAATTRVRVLRSWDRMRLPLPFGRGVLVAGAPITVPRDGAAAALPAIEAALTAACDAADAWVAAR